MARVSRGIQHYVTIANQFSEAIANTGLLACFELKSGGLKRENKISVDNNLNSRLISV